jgi:Uncharacterized protein involved in an early stage of isoprenoid biosynthesis
MGNALEGYPQRVGCARSNPYGHICQTRGHLAPRKWSNEHDQESSGDSFRLWRYDGAEIHESVITLLRLDQRGAQVQCFAPNIAQMHVIDHLTGQEMPNRAMC